MFLLYFIGLRFSAYLKSSAEVSLLSNFTLLNDLNLTNCHKITDVGLSHLSKMTRLNDLNLSYCYQITNEGLSHLSNMMNLKVPER